MSDTVLTTQTTPWGDEELRRRNRATIEKYFAMGGNRTGRHLLFAEDGAGGLYTTDTGEPIQSVGHEALAAADEWNNTYFSDWSWSNVEIFETQDPNRFWVECDGGGVVHFTAYPAGRYENHYIHSFQMNDGLIQTYWEYMNPCSEMRALGIEVPRVERG
ncbi:MAG: PhzA/PhzB family protein [Microbacterium sp.]|uniref:PhzA/PhzB family protein n=1 Tax=Microbacterium sp. TaxID=51671 RepID=UPI0039E3239B